jgi:hypothetical protein
MVLQFRFLMHHFMYCLNRNISVPFRKLQQIELCGNPIHTFHHNAVVNLPSLKKLQ